MYVKSRTQEHNTYRNTALNQRTSQIQNNQIFGTAKYKRIKFKRAKYSEQAQAEQANIKINQIQTKPM